MKNIFWISALIAAPLLAQAPMATTAPPPSPLRLSTISGAPLSAGQEKEALEFLLTDVNDRNATEKQLHNTKTRAPEVYWAHLRSALTHKERLAKLKAEDPQRYELYQREQQLDRKVDALSAKYRAAKTDAARDQIRAEMKTALGDLFDVREQGSLLAQVDRLQREIKREQDRTAQRRTEKDQIVGEELKSFTAVN